MTFQFDGFILPFIDFSGRTNTAHSEVKKKSNMANSYDTGSVLREAYSQLILGVSEILIHVGGFKLPGLTQGESAAVMATEWRDVLSQKKFGSLAKLAAAKCFLPDAASMSYQFGYIGRARDYVSDKVHALLFPADDDRGDCSCGSCGKCVFGSDRKQ